MIDAQLLVCIDSMQEGHANLNKLTALSAELDDGQLQSLRALASVVFK
jgi:hypothetical protein